MGTSGQSLAPILNGLVDAELIDRLEDPIRDKRPMYHPADSLLRFHYTIIRPHHSRLGHPTTSTIDVWRSLSDRFTSQVVGPCFEAVTRSWVRHYASPETVGGYPVNVGPTVVDGPDGNLELDVVVAADDGEPSQRTVTALGEAKSGEQLTPRHLRRLEECRAALGRRASDAKLLVVGIDFSKDLLVKAAQRPDVELVDLDRLYHGS